MMDLFSDQEDEEEGVPVHLTDYELRILPDFEKELRRRGSAEDKIQWIAEHGAKVRNLYSHHLLFSSLFSRYTLGRCHI
ncbi:hypothetical protein SERLA73DRAFT_184182 [Serpula lacrymans var. lacrymans S7.3]|uniref:Uncharacterized protein n=2 Tax=Serpula lacrymans var. lacrymans TaxID=341189 RepID=F8Q2Q3_SERL3|nr:uncharacterized protein SERLADRAFT_471733 [Serpula lacrymans var. lacrymans S7.9]EGN97464.1 hypothetical protein SERLA73DRAFT_184182 [Serpula lacrymans var. lacrymans S7.3]EGO23056.1 hypothetical protein SERLADRAFT_471733 [Serpula lacrymans var. lacrymans S7.9]